MKWRWMIRWFDEAKAIEWWTLDRYRVSLIKRLKLVMHHFQFYDFTYKSKAFIEFSSQFSERKGEHCQSHPVGYSSKKKKQHIDGKRNRHSIDMDVGTTFKSFAFPTKESNIDWNSFWFESFRFEWTRYRAL